MCKLWDDCIHKSLLKKELTETALHPHSVPGNLHIFYSSKNFMKEILKGNPKSIKLNLKS